LDAAQPPPAYTADATQVTLSAASPPPARPEPSPLELGVGAFLMSGGPAGSYAGASPFLVTDVGQRVFVRPAILLGEATGTSIHAILAAARVDTCARLAGAYATGSGIQLDLCGGLDAGFSYVSAGTQVGTPSAGVGLPYIDIGPSIDLRAEIGRLAVTLRAVGGYEIARAAYTDVTGAQVVAPSWPLRFEVGFSWDLHGEEAPAPVEYEARRE
jgi:hypothetical protein